MQTQVIPYLKEILKDGVGISLLTFEPEFKESWTSEQIEDERKKLAAQNITWHVLPYHKSPSVLATFYDVLNGTRLVRKLLLRENYDILHCRVHLPALMASIARKLSRKRPKILFDIRGFFPEEYTDAGVWPEGGWLYRAAKRGEHWLLKEADGFVVLTEKAREILFPESKQTGVDKLGRPVEVIPCCVDQKRFALADEDSRSEVRRQLKIGDRFVIAYVGSFGGWYLTDEMFEFFDAAREADPSIFIMMLTQRDKAMVIDRLTAAGFGKTDIFVDRLLPSEIPQYLNAADAGLSFIKRCYSKQSSSPTKNAEYLAAGLPIIANPGVGDVDSQITEHNVGVIVEQFDRESYIDAVDRLRMLGDIRERCRDAASTVFDLETIAGMRYRRLYVRILG